MCWSRPSELAAWRGVFCRGSCFGRDTLRVYPLCPGRLPAPLAWQRSSTGSLSVVLGYSAFDLCEVLSSVTVAMEKCQDAWAGVGIIKADMLVVCLPWCTVSPCSHDVCGFQ